jgi:uncharacterized membrane protein
MERTKNNLNLTIIWTILLGAGMTFMILNNTHEGVWCDEAVSAEIINHPFIDLLSFNPPDSHPPLYYVMLKVFSTVFGNSVFALRAFSALGIFALALLGFGPVKKIIGEKGGLIFSFLVFITPASLSYGQEIRMYSWAAFFVTGSLIYGYLCLKEPKTRRWIVYAGFLIASCYIHYYAMAAAVFINVAVGAVVLGGKNKTEIRRFITGSLIVIAVCMPSLIHLFTFVSHSDMITWIPPITTKTLIRVFAYPFGIKLDQQPIFAMLAFLTLFILALWGAYMGKKTGKQNVFMQITALMAFIGPVAVGVIYSLLVQPAFVSRYVLPMYGLILLSAAYSLSLIKNKICAVFCAIIFLLCCPQLISIEKNRYNLPSNQAYEYIRENIRPDDCFIHTNIFTLNPMAYYFPLHSHFNDNICTNTPDIFAAPYIDAILGNDMDAFLENKKNIWVINDSTKMDKTELEEWLKSKGLKLTGSIKEFKASHSWVNISLCRAEKSVKK